MKTGKILMVSSSNNDPEKSDVPDEKIFQRDKLLFNLMLHVYEEENHRNDKIESKVGSMIAVLGVMLTILTSFFGFLLSNFINIKEVIFVIVLLFIFLCAVGSYLYSVNMFIKAYSFNDFEEVPNHNYLLDAAVNNVPEHNIIAELIATFKQTIDNNCNVINNRINHAKKGFIYFKNGIIFTVILVIFFILSLII